MPAQLGSYASAGDLAALDELIGEPAAEGVIHRDDVGLLAARHLYVARRPG